MSTPGRFLIGMAQAMSAMNLYGEGHPARERALDRAYGALVDLQSELPSPHFNFLGDEVVLDSLPLRELRHWDWGARLSGHGIQRLEFVGEVSRDDFEAFLEEVHLRLSGADVPTSAVRQGRPSAIRYGELALQDETEESARRRVTATLAYSLRDEMQGVQWLHDELKAGRQLRMLEAEAIVRSLSVAMHADQAYLIPLLKMKEFDEYTVTHALNVAVLSMALAEFIGLAPREVKAFGIAGLLHDLGKVTVPIEILNKPGKLTETEREVFNRHPVEGARIILDTEEHLDLAAVVAYEHHIRFDGGGYPALRYPRSCHQASNLVHVCDVFDALRTRRPYRDPMTTERALASITAAQGEEFDPELAQAFVRMMGQWEGSVAELDTAAPVLGGEEPSEGESP